MASAWSFLLLCSTFLEDLPSMAGSTLKIDIVRRCCEHRGSWVSVLYSQAGHLLLQQKAVLQENDVGLTNCVHINRDRDHPQMKRPGLQDVPAGMCSMPRCRLSLDAAKRGAGSFTKTGSKRHSYPILANARSQLPCV